MGYAAAMGDVNDLEEMQSKEFCVFGEFEKAYVVPVTSEQAKKMLGQQMQPAERKALKQGIVLVEEFRKRFGLSPFINAEAPVVGEHNSEVQSIDDQLAL
ncbi:MAG: hypothetical protein ACT4OY_07220 [Alphaproteobacteria bacterium]